MNQLVKSEWKQRGPKTKYPIVQAKKCSACDQYKPLTEFHSNTGHSTGLYTQCRQCYANKRREQYRDYNLRRKKNRKGQTS